MNGGHKSTIWCFDFNQSGTHIVSCSEDKSWVLWSITATGYKKLGEVNNTHFRSIYSISWCKSPDVNRIATAGADNQIMLYEIPKVQLDDSEKNPFAP